MSLDSRLRSLSGGRLNKSMKAFNSFMEDCDLLDPPPPSPPHRMVSSLGLMVGMGLLTVG